MENISRGPTFRDFVTIHTEGRCRTTWLQDYRVQEYRPPSPPFIKCNVLRESLSEDSQNHKVHRVATAAFWRTFHHEGKISPGWWGWGVHAHPLSLHLPSPVKLQCTLQLSGRIHPVSSLVKICTLWSKYYLRNSKETLLKVWMQAVV